MTETSTKKKILQYVAAALLVLLGAFGKNAVDNFSPRVFSVFDKPNITMVALYDYLVFDDHLFKNEGYVAVGVGRGSIIQIGNNSDQAICVTALELVDSNRANALRRTVFPIYPRNLEVCTVPPHKEKLLKFFPSIHASTPPPGKDEDPSSPMSSADVMPIDSSELYAIISRGNEKTDRILLRGHIKGVFAKLRPVFRTNWESMSEDQLLNYEDEVTKAHYQRQL